MFVGTSGYQNPLAHTDLTCLWMSANESPDYAGFSIGSDSDSDSLIVMYVKGTEICS